MSGQKNAAPVIIKRKKVVNGGGHHGGAWKVAYADFVTAMMAFFLLMWLLNATTEKQRKGIADYFAPTVPVNRVSGGGDGAFGGDSLFSEMTLPRNGTGATSDRPTESDKARGETGTSGEGADADEGEEALRMIEEALMGRGGESNMASELFKHINTRITDEGLVIELFALPGAPLFERRTDTPTRRLEDIAFFLVESMRIVVNPVAVEGHVAARPLVLRENPVWELSTERAMSMRRLLVRAGLDPARSVRVTGHADREPAVDVPMALRNNRIEVILLRDMPR